MAYGFQGFFRLWILYTLSIARLKPETVIKSVSGLFDSLWLKCVLPLDLQIQLVTEGGVFDSGLVVVDKHRFAVFYLTREFITLFILRIIWNETDRFSESFNGYRAAPHSGRNSYNPGLGRKYTASIWSGSFPSMTSISASKLAQGSTTSVPENHRNSAICPLLTGSSSPSLHGAVMMLKLNC